MAEAATRAARGISAPPEVVFNLLTDPDRRASWLPGAWRTDGSQADDEAFEVRLTPQGGAGWSGMLRVRAGDAGGSSVELRVDEPAPAGRTAPEQILDDIAREVVGSFHDG